MGFNGLNDFQSKRVLLLQGPVGPFFSRLSKDLTAIGAQVFKINFNAGDKHYYKAQSDDFVARMDEWPQYLENYLLEKEIDVVLLFGDCRPIHLPVHGLAEKHGIRVGVFEEGYLRPDYITLEEHGVNGRSKLPKSPMFYMNMEKPEVKRTYRLGSTFWHAATYATIYYFHAGMFWWKFPFYTHHRPLSLWQSWFWVKATWRKLWYRLKERRVRRFLIKENPKSYYLVPLQVHNDAQIKFHSQYESTEEFLDEIIPSFAQHADSQSFLVIKHHPLDRGYKDYTQFVKERAQMNGVSGRIIYVHDLHLPSLLDNARGVVVINSTVGLSAIHHKVPVKVCGDAVYDLNGLAWQGKINDFWSTAGEDFEIDRKLYFRFRGYLKKHVQYNGNFYKKLDESGYQTGVRWGAVSVVSSDVDKTTRHSQDVKSYIP